MVGLNVFAKLMQLGLKYVPVQREYTDKLSWCLIPEEPRSRAREVTCGAWEPRYNSSSFLMFFLFGYVEEGKHCLSKTVRCQCTQIEIKLTLAVLPGAITDLKKHRLWQKSFF